MIRTPSNSQSSPLIDEVAVRARARIGEPTLIAVDESGLYWGGAEGTDASDTSSAVYMCPLTGCPSSGPIPIAIGPAGVYDVTLDGDLVYWVSGSYGIRAVAKP